jgi:hypothetical protein
MTRNEFDSRFAASQDTTSGWSDEELEEINDAVFAEVSEMDLYNDITDSHVKNMMARVMNSF